MSCVDTKFVYMVQFLQIGGGGGGGAGLIDKKRLLERGV